MDRKIHAFKESTAMAQTVQFTRQQIEYLERMFPEQIATPSTTNEAIRYFGGQRSVVIAIKALQQRTGEPDGLAK